MTYKILGVPLSPFTRKVLMFAQEMQVEAVLSDLNPYDPPKNFREISPLGQVPVLQADELTLCDSSVICAYLAATHTGQASLFPKDPALFGRALWLEEYADTALFSVISKGVFRPIFINEMRGIPADLETVKRTVAEDLPPILAYLEAELADREWFCGDAFSIADLSVYAQMANLRHAHYLPSAADFPALMQHFERISSRPVARDLHETELRYLGKMRAMLAKRAEGVR